MSDTPHASGTGMPNYRTILRNDAGIRRGRSSQPHRESSGPRASLCPWRAAPRAA